MQTKTAKPKVVESGDWTAARVLAELEKLGDAQTKKTLLRHGAKEPLFGVKIGDMKPLAKRVGKNHQLALELYDSGNYDAQYMAAMLADPKEMTRKALDLWARTTQSHTLCGSVLPAMAAESRFGIEVAREWIESDKESIASAGWTAFTMLVSMKADSELNLREIEKLLGRVEKQIHAAPNQVRYAMNMFVIGVGGGIAALTEKAKAVAKKIGKVEVDMGDTACQVPGAYEYIVKIEKMGRVGKKRKTAMC